MATSLAFNEQFYLQQNPDVVAAIARGQFANAQQHFNQFGAGEQRDPNQFFDTSFYLTQYPDVLNARANPLDHFLNFGAAELRFANATADAAIDADGSNFANEFDAQAYLTANPDLANAVGAGRAFENAYEHYVLFGQFESRPGTPAGGPFTNTGAQPGSGQTFTLTPAATGDVFVGTSGNDTFNAAATTLQSVDVLDGGAGNDILNATLSNGNALVAPVLTNIETINLQTLATGGSLGLGNAIGVENISVAGNGALVLDDVDVSATNDFSLNNFNNSVTVNTTTLAGTGATAETINLALNGTGTNTAFALDQGAGGNVENFNIASNGTSANRIALDGNGFAAGTTTTITGSAALTVAAAAATLSGQTINASAATGNVTLDIDVNAGANVVATNFTGVDSFVLRDTVTAGDDDVSLFNLSSGANIRAATDLDAVTFTVANAASSTNDVLNLTLQTTAATASDVDLTSVTVANVETINITSAGAPTTGAAAAQQNSIGTLNAAQATNIVLSGASDLAIDLGTTNTTGTAALAVNASALSGDLVLASGTAATVTTITGGTGENTFRFDLGDINDSITNFAAGNDIGIGAGTVVGTFSNQLSASATSAAVQGAASLQDAASASAALVATSTANEAIAFSYQGNQYLFLNEDADNAFTAGTDVIVQVTGLSDTTTLTGSNFFFVS